MEQSFRHLKRAFRKRTGKSVLTQEFRAILSDTPLIKNLSQPDYLNLILNGKFKLEDRFAEIEINEVRAELKIKKYQEQLISSDLKKKLRTPQIMENLGPTAQPRNLLA